MSGSRYPEREISVHLSCHRPTRVFLIRMLYKDSYWLFLYCNSVLSVSICVLSYVNKEMIDWLIRSSATCCCSRSTIASSCLIILVTVHFISAQGCEVLYCDQRVCMSVCSHISKTTWLNFTKFSISLVVTCGRGSVLFWRKIKYVMYFRCCGGCRRVSTSDGAASVCANGKPACSVQTFRSNIGMWQTPGAFPPPSVKVK